MAFLLDQVDIDTLLNAVRRQEGSTQAADPDAPMRPFDDLISKAGAVGAMQIVPSAATEVGYGIPSIFDVARGLGFDVETEDEATSRMLARDPQIAREYAKNYLIGAYDELGSVDAAVGSYNVGIPAMKRILSGDKPMPSETGMYIPEVHRWYSESGRTYPREVIPAPQLRPKGLLD